MSFDLNTSIYSDPKRKEREKKYCFFKRKNEKVRRKRMYVHDIKTSRSGVPFVGSKGM